MGSITDFLNSYLSQSGQALSFWQIGISIGIAYLGGVLTSLTPCIYPMIPITISVIGGTTGVDHPNWAKQKWKVLGLRCLSYVLGMSIVYALLGVIAGLSGQIFGTLTNTFGWYMGLGIVMTFASLMMMDVITFDPQAWWDRYKRKRNQNKPHQPVDVFEKKKFTLLGVFALGLSSGFIAAPCSTPVFAAILAFIARTQSVGLGLVLMLFFAFGLGTLLVIIALFTGALQIFPKSGNWMRIIKILSGILLLIFGNYLFFQAGVISGY